MLLDAGYSDRPKGYLQTDVPPAVRLDQTLEESHGTCHSGAPCVLLSLPIAKHLTIMSRRDPYKQMTINQA